MKVLVADIKIKKRARQNFEEIEELSESIKRLGLLNPIIIDEKNVLIAGERRLRAVKLLGWSHIDANIVSVKNKAEALEIEIEENTQRQQFSEEELLAVFTRLNRAQQPNIFIHFWRWLVDLFRRIFKK